ncbi:MAG: glycosyltransferase family 9 protein [Deltaproteobacteria bacterium]|nr:glycosyltransferase family 9 protein [Deltaproteobacteria bacterium]
MKILIVKLGAVGDVAHTLPALHSLRKSFPEAFIAWVVEKKALQVIRDNPYIDEVILFERKELERTFRKDGLFAAIRFLASFGKKLKSYHFDIAIDFQTLFKSGLITWLSGAKKRVGFDKWRELNKLFTNSRLKSNKRHTIDKYLDLVVSVGGSADSTPVKIYYAKEDADYVDRFIRDEGLESKKWIAINPGASWTSKLWGAQRYAILCDLLNEASVPHVIVWGPGEEKIVEEIQEKAGNELLIAPPTSIKQLACLLERSSLYVGGDTGPMHMAVAMGTPVAGIFGPSDPERNGPYGEGQKVLQADLDCIKCWKRSCPTVECMEKVTPQSVIDAIKEILK